VRWLGINSLRIYKYKLQNNKLHKIERKIALFLKLEDFDPNYREAFDAMTSKNECLYSRK